MANEIVIVGGGPVGLLAAIEVARKGFSPLIFEEHSQIGVPDHCAGLVSVNGLQMLNLNIPSEIIINKVKNAVIHSPSGYQLPIHGGKTRAYVIDRSRFDQYLADVALSENVKIMLKTQVKKLYRKNSEVIVYTNKGIYQTKVAIVAWGAKQHVKRRLEGVLPAIQYELKDTPTLLRDTVELFLGSFASGLFAWIIPKKENEARVGLASNSGKIRNLLESFLKKTKLANSKVTKIRGGFVLTCGPLKKTFSHGILLAGDAAGQVKATTGGGVVTGGICGKIAGSTAVEAVEKEDNSEGFLSIYQKRWKNILGREFAAMNLVRRVLNGLSDKLLDSLILEAKQLKLNQLIETFGHMDLQKKVIFEILKKPFNFLKLSPILIHGLAKSMLM
ncbi:MAG: NAD(P)/FAD-dependent oxidoreductase [Candidatus Odinarchaeia archaeon]